MEREGSDRTKRSGRPAAIACAGCASSILHDHYVGRERGADCVDVGAQSEEMHCYYRFCPRGDCRRNPSRIDVEGFIDINEHQFCAAVEYSVGGRYPCERRHDNFVAFTDAERQQCQMEARGAIAYRNRMLHAMRSE